MAAGIRSWVPRTRTRYGLALSVLADYERSRGWQSMPCPPLCELLVSYSLGRAP